MALTKFIYPEIDEMKYRLAFLCGQLYQQLKNCFLGTNNLIVCINQHTVVKFETVTINVNQTIADNCGRLVTRLNEINGYLERRRSDLENSLGTELFWRLMTVRDVQESTFQKWVDPAIATAFVFADLALLRCMNNGTALVTLTQSLGIVKAGFLASVGLGLLFLGIDLIVSYIFGKHEKNKLANGIMEYELALQQFEPAAERFYEETVRMKIMISHPQN